MKDCPVPEAYRLLCDGIVDGARRILERDGRLVGVAFIGRWDANEDDRQIIRVDIGEFPKSKGLEIIATVAKLEKAEFILIVDEIWMIRTATVDHATDLESEYERVKDMPGRIDAVMFHLETYEGVWAAFVPRITRDEAAKTYSFGEVEFMFADSASGSFVGLLAKPNGASLQ